jgi:hypothetical protein
MVDKKMAKNELFLPAPPAGLCRYVWARPLLYLGAFSDQPLDKLEQEFQELGVWDPSDKEEGDFQGSMNSFAEAFSSWRKGYGPVFSKIYQTLEGLRTFESK